MYATLIKLGGYQKQKCKQNKTKDKKQTQLSTMGRIKDI